MEERIIKFIHCPECGLNAVVKKDGSADCAMCGEEIASRPVKMKLIKCPGCGKFHKMQTNKAKGDKVVFVCVGERGCQRTLKMKITKEVADL